VAVLCQTSPADDDTSLGSLGHTSAFMPREVIKCGSAKVT